VPTRQLMADFLRPSYGDAESRFGRYSGETGPRNNDSVDDCRVYRRRRESQGLRRVAVLSQDTVTPDRGNSGRQAELFHLQLVE